jgi:hypothetical protein
MLKASPCFLENGDLISRMLNNVGQQNEIKFVPRRIDIKDILRHKTEARISFEGASLNAVLVDVKSYPAADASFLAQTMTDVFPGGSGPRPRRKESAR